MIEWCFGILKNSYSSVGCGIFCSRKVNRLILCNISAALFNRGRLLIMQMTRNLSVMYQLVTKIFPQHAFFYTVYNFMIIAMI